MYDPIVFTSRQTFLQRTADYVRTGHIHWTAGVVPVDRVHRLVRKFTRLYAVGLDRNRRFRAKRRGEANATLLLVWMSTVQTHIQWVLLVTPGDHPAHELERLEDAGTREGRVHLFDYELVHLTKRRSVRRRYPGSVSDTDHPTPAGERTTSDPGQGRLVHTWRMRLDVYETLRERALAAARGRNAGEVRALLQELYHVPGFYGVRQQVGRVVALLRREYQRRRGSLAGFPELPALYYVVRRPDRGTRLSRLNLQTPVAPVGGTSTESAPGRCGAQPA